MTENKGKNIRKHSKTKAKRKRTRKEKLLIAVCVLVGAAILFSAIFIIVWNSKPLDNQKGKDFDAKLESGFDSEILTTKEEQVNFLIAGEKDMLTDVLMVASVNVKTNSVEILQIPRDSYVSEAYSTGKINAAYTQYGSSDLKNIARTEKMIYDQFKINIDHYVVVNLSAFRRIIDSMGGIPINITEEFVFEKGKVIKPGKQTLNGEKAEWFVRERHNRGDGSDISRIKMQRVFLAAFVERVKTLGVKKIVSSVIPAFVKDIDNLSSDMTVNQMSDYAKMFINIPQSNIRIHMIPGEGYGFLNAKGKCINSVYAIHAQSTADLLNTYFRPYSPKVEVDKLGIITIKGIKNVDSYENTQDDFQSLLNGDKPGKKKNDSSKVN